MRFTDLTILASLVLATQAPWNALAAEVELRTPLGAPTFEVSANADESSKEISALVNLAKTLDHFGNEMNPIFPTAPSPMPSSPFRAAGTLKSTDLVAKNVADPIQAETKIKKAQVFDHYENMQMPVYKTVEYEAPVDASGVANE